MHVDVSLIPGLHKRGLDLPLSRRLAFRKWRGRGGLGVVIAFFVLVTFLLQHRAVHRMVREGAWVGWAECRSSLYHVSL